MNPVAEKYACVIAGVVDDVGKQRAPDSQGYFARAVFSQPGGDDRHSDAACDGQRCIHTLHGQLPAEAVKNYILDYLSARHRSQMCCSGAVLGLEPLLLRNCSSSQLSDLDVCLFWCTEQTTAGVETVIAEAQRRNIFASPPPIVLLFSLVKTDDGCSHLPPLSSLSGWTCPPQSFATELSRVNRSVLFSTEAVMCHSRLVRNRQPLSMGPPDFVTVEGLLREVLYKVGVAAKYGA
jgi:hypothetical protein